MTKAEARARFYARSALAGDPPVSMMAVHHEGEKMAEMYWVLKNRNGSYVAKGDGEFRLTAARRYAMRFASANAARDAEDRKLEWGFEVFRVTRRAPTRLAAARRSLFDRIDVCTSEDAGPYSDVAHFKTGLTGAYVARKWERIR